MTKEEFYDALDFLSESLSHSLILYNDDKVVAAIYNNSVNNEWKIKKNIIDFKKNEVTIYNMDLGVLIVADKVEKKKWIK